MAGVEKYLIAKSSLKLAEIESKKPDEPQQVFSPSPTRTPLSPKPEVVKSAVIDSLI